MPPAEPLFESVPVVVPSLGGLSPMLTATTLLAGAAVAFYLGSRAVADVTRDPGRGVVLAGVLPVGVVGVAAAAAGLGEVATAAVFATAVGLVTLVLGMALLTRGKVTGGPVNVLPAALLLPAAVLASLAGAGGRLGPIEVALLAATGAGAVFVLLPRDARPGFGQLLQGAAALAVVLAGAWLATLGARVLGTNVGRDIVGIDATMLAGPMLVLPVIGLALPMAGRGEHARVIASLCASSVLVIAAVLPVVAAVALLRAGGEALPLAPRLFRVDAAVLGVVGLLVLPFAAGRWRPGAWEGLGLLVLYVAYLIVNVSAAR